MFPRINRFWLNTRNARGPSCGRREIFQMLVEQLIDPVYKNLTLVPPLCFCCLECLLIHRSASSIFLPRRFFEDYSECRTIVSGLDESPESSPDTRACLSQLSVTQVKGHKIVTLSCCHATGAERRVVTTPTILLTHVNLKYSSHALIEDKRPPMMILKTPAGGWYSISS